MMTQSYVDIVKDALDRVQSDFDEVLQDYLKNREVKLKNGHIHVDFPKWGFLVTYPQCGLTPDELDKAIKLQLDIAVKYYEGDKLA